MIFKHLDPASLVVISLTFLLFFVSLAVKGITHEMLLEAGVLLVSIKLIISTYKNARLGVELGRKLDDIYSVVAESKKVT